ncbi:MAG: hypothetical protein LIP02_03700 [Bacteroidales bacterium]|nr:hypothetical protein [Bacteroidales bacterium]
MCNKILIATVTATALASCGARSSDKVAAEAPPAAQGHRTAAYALTWSIVSALPADAFDDAIMQTPDERREYLDIYYDAKDTPQDVARMEWFNYTEKRYGTLETYRVADPASERYLITVVSYGGAPAVTTRQNWYVYDTAKGLVLKGNNSGLPGIDVALIVDENRLRAIDADGAKTILALGTAYYTSHLKVSRMAEGHPPVYTDSVRAYIDLSDIKLSDDPITSAELKEACSTVRVWDGTRFAYPN